MASFKPDASFFKKIAIGANGAQAICEDLSQHGHAMTELERGSTNTKLWKDVKRKRVRIPDLICRSCGRRVESRAKTKPELSMSHSDVDQERSWDYGMLSEDWVAFPISVATNSGAWSKGLFLNKASYWHERDWSEWEVDGKINYFTVETFRRTPPDGSRRKGVTEGSELTLIWRAKFATCAGQVEAVEDNKIKIRPGGGRVRTLRLSPGLNAYVSVGENVRKHQILFSGPTPVSEQDLRCPGRLTDGFFEACLASRERTVRFSGVKLSRIRGSRDHIEIITDMSHDSEEDLYVRLEALAYLASVDSSPVEELFGAYLCDPDAQIRLESVITVGEIGTPGAVGLLGTILHDQNREYFLRSAAAWSLGNIGASEAQEQLKKAFSDVSWSIREEALDALVSIGESALPALVPGLHSQDEDVAAGCAEVVRQLGGCTRGVLGALGEKLLEASPPKWLVWLAGHVSPEELEEAIGSFDKLNAEVSYAVSLLWSFARCWIARRWELQRGVFPLNGGI
ncbi:MAG: HEAT repeat domain-containing protein [Phycisphaerae bacterium]|nr:HEAT repeat domain-containing protein [Phycisphaerae bacterium]